MLLLRVQPLGHLPLVYELLLQLDDFFVHHFGFFSLFIKPDTTSGRGFSLRNQRHHMVIQQQLVNHQVALAQGIP